MKTQAQLKQYIAEHPGWSVDRMRMAMARHQVTAAEIRAAMDRTAMDGQGPKPVTPTGGFGKPITNLLDQFDDIGKVTKAMKQLSKDSYFEDDELRRKLFVSPDRWKAVKVHPALTLYRFTLPRGNVVWIHKDAQAKLTAAINLDQN